MRKTIKFFILVSLLLTPFSSFAQLSTTTNATSTATSTNNGGGSSGVGAAIGIGLGVGAAAIGISALTQRLTSVSFGGRILAVIPCSGGMRHVTIAPAGAFPVTYIWTPATLTYSAGPPRRPGQQILGLADFPWVCFIGGGGFFSSPIPLYGLRMRTVGTSPVVSDIVSGDIGLY